MKTLNILAVGDPAVDVYVSEETKIISNYEKKNNIKINFDIIPWVDYYDKLIDSFNNYTYDIVMVAGHLWLKDFVENKNLLAIDINTNSDYDFLDFIDNIKTELTYNNKAYLLPSFCDGHILIYRKNQIKDTIPQSIKIQDLANIVKNNKTTDKTTFVLKSHPSEIFLDFLPYLRAYNGDLYTKEGNTTLTTKNALEALKTYVNLKGYCSKDVNTYGNEEVKNAIQKDLCKLGVSWSGQLGQIMNDDCLNKEDLAFANIDTSWNVTWSFGINKFTKYQKESTKFLHYLTSKEIDKLVGAHCGNPTRYSTFIDGLDKYPWYQTVLNMVNTSKQLPSFNNLGNVIGITTQYLSKAFNNELSLQDALQSAQNDITNKK